MRATAVHAHRGSPDAATGIRENTLDAFFRARQLGADGVELDVRLTADGALAVHHDPVIQGVGTIAELTADQLPAFVPLLHAALDACVGLMINIEIKNLPSEPGFDPDESVAKQVADLVVAQGRATEVVVSSFWPPSLEAVHASHPEVPTGLLLASWTEPGSCVPAAVDLGCGAIHPHSTLVCESLVDEARRAGLSIAAWTVNDVHRLKALAGLGIDTVITDDVPLALGALDGA
jgi:glycerophosphoryl diester phosphodiesterase